MNTNHKWTLVSDDTVPDGCVDLEVMYEDGTIKKYCSCDIHWAKHLGDTTPLYWRHADV